MKYYDIIIIGSGIAGLYAANQIKRFSPSKTFLILEKNKKRDLGGRAGNDTFYGTEVAIGAGVGRKHKDHRLIRLLKQAKIEYSEFESNRNHSDRVVPVDILKIMKVLKSEYKTHHQSEKWHNKTFKQFFISVLGENLYDKFVIMTGYTDYENADIYETLYHYGMDDNTSGWTALHVPWKQLTNTLYEKIGKDHFKFSSEVTRITKIHEPNEVPSSIFKIETNGGGAMYCSNKLVIATTISSVNRILERMYASPASASASASPYKQIHGQAFLMVYAKFDAVSNEIMKKYVTTFTVVPGPLQKLIPMNPEKGVYMVAYSDNNGASALKHSIENTRKNCELYSKWVEDAFGIQRGNLNIMAIKSYYWTEGTHFYEPLKYGDGGSNNISFKNRIEFIRKAQKPEPNIVVVGEAVSRNQGWVEGALESVDAVITKEWVIGAGS